MKSEHVSINSKHPVLQVRLKCLGQAAVWSVASVPGTKLTHEAPVSEILRRSISVDGYTKNHVIRPDGYVFRKPHVGGYWASSQA